MTWAGMGVKGGGHLFILGADTFEGAAFRLDGSPSASLTEVNVTSLRAGPGLGGSVSLSLFFAFNVAILSQIDDMYTGRDWGFNISFPEEKLPDGKDAVTAIKEAANLKIPMSKLDPKSVEAFRTLGSLFWSGPLRCPARSCRRSTRTGRDGCAFRR